MIDNLYYDEKIKEMFINFGGFDAAFHLFTHKNGELWENWTFYCYRTENNQEIWLYWMENPIYVEKLLSFLDSSSQTVFFFNLTVKHLIYLSFRLNRQLLKVFDSFQINYSAKN